jgi:hypothetical protein
VRDTQVADRVSSAVNNGNNVVEVNVARGNRRGADLTDVPVAIYYRPTNASRDFDPKFVGVDPALPVPLVVGATRNLSDPQVDSFWRRMRLSDQSGNSRLILGAQLVERKHHQPTPNFTLAPTNIRAVLLSERIQRDDRISSLPLRLW